MQCAYVRVGMHIHLTILFAEREQLLAQHQAKQTEHAKVCRGGVGGSVGCRWVCGWVCVHHLAMQNECAFKV